MSELGNYYSSVSSVHYSPSPPPARRREVTPPIVPRKMENWSSSKPTYLTEGVKASKPPMELPTSTTEPSDKPKRAVDQSIYAKQREQFLSDVLLLTEFVEEYSKQLPVQIKVLRGFFGPSTRLTISTDDMFNVHLVKRMKVARVSDSHGTIYSVPLNSSIEFGMVYDPTNSYGGTQAIAGFKMRVDDLIQLTTLPKVICCLKGWKSDDGKLVLHDCEQLVVRGVLKVRMKSKKMLKVFSLSTKQEFLLPEECKALFSTAASLVKMVLADIIEHVTSPFPCGAMIYLNADIFQNPATAKRAHDIPPILTSRMVDITEVIVETSLIASNVIDLPASYLEDCTEEELNQMIDIPLEGGLLDIEVAVVPPKSTSDQLYEDTRSIYEKFTPHKVKPLRNLTCDHAAAAQFIFSTAVRTGWETHGVELDEPAYTYLDFASVRRKTSKMSDSKKPNTNGRSSLEDGHGLPLGKARKVSDDQKTVPPTIAPKLPPRSSIPNTSTSGNEATPSYRDIPPPPPPLKSTADYREKEEPPKKPFATLPHSFKTIKAKTVPEAISRSAQRDDSLLEGSLSSSGGGSFEDAVFMEDKSENGRGVAGRVGRVEEQLAAVQASLVALREAGGGGGGEEGKEKEWKSAIEERLRVLEEQVKKLQFRKPVPPIPPAPPRSPPTKEETIWGSTVEENRQYLKNMSHLHVLDLLEAMELSKYSEVFKKEQVSGDVLLELGDEELKEELGVASKLHRIRLVKVINGQHSAKNILAGLDPYS